LNPSEPGEASEKAQAERGPTEGRFGSFIAESMELIRTFGGVATSLTVPTSAAGG
jgi:hypothetical protein